MSIVQVTYFLIYKNVLFCFSAIFGSYSYDPVKQVFVPPPPADNDTVHSGPKIPDQIINGSYVLSTAVGDPTHTPEQEVTNHTDPVFRKHVTPVTYKNTAWWIRPKLGFKNLTAVHKLNKL